MPFEHLAVSKVTEQATREALIPILQTAIPNQYGNMETTRRHSGFYKYYLEDCWATNILKAWGETVEPCGETGCSLM
jgi:hypothetical protein